MDRFKNILRKAVAEKIAKVTLNENSIPLLYKNEKESQKEGNQLTTRDWLSQILDFLFPEDDNINSGAPTKGVLNIPKLGQVLVIASKGAEFKLSLYMPGLGDKLFESDWKNIHALQSKSPFSSKTAFETNSKIASEINAQSEIPAAPPPVPLFNVRKKDIIEEPEVDSIKNNSDLESYSPKVSTAPIPIDFNDNNSDDDTEEQTESNQEVFKYENSSIPLSVDVENIPEYPSHPGDSGLGLSNIHFDNIPDDEDDIYEPSGLNSSNTFSDNNEDIETQHSQPEAITPQLIKFDVANVFTANNMESDDSETDVEKEIYTDTHIPKIPSDSIFSMNEDDDSNFQPQMETPVIHTPQLNHIPHAKMDKPKVISIDFASSDPKPVFKSGATPAIDAILIDMISKRSSDLHLTVGQPIVFRIDGSIKRMPGENLTPAQMEKFILPILPEENALQFAETSDTDFAYEIKNVGRFRVNVFRDNVGVGAVMRHIPSEVLTADQLGLPPIMINLCKLSKGLVLVTGPTGSGKSTTLAAMIDHINKNRADHLLTIEDPIEFVHRQQRCLINQREVGKHTKSFSKALKAALREDPDIILIGELRDLETIHIAIETAETGHLVFGTLHTTTAVSTIDRVIDQFPADQQSQIRMMLASSLKGVIAQTLLPKIGGGRVAAHEILIPNDAVANMIRERKNHMIENHMQTQKVDGNLLLNESLLNLVVKKVVSFEDAYIKSVDKKSFIEMAGKKGIKHNAA